jgi:site-specific DNA-methyltransferase (adenine-specific)
MRYYQAFEFMFVFSKNNPSVFNPIVEDRRNKWNDKRTSRVRPVTRNKSGVFTEKNVKIEGQVKLQNVWSYVVSGGSVAKEMFAHEHPAIYPESMARDHIISWSNEGDMILDPFAGSGTTGKVANQLKRNCILIEKELDYINIIRKRLNEQ